MIINAYLRGESVMKKNVLIMVIILGTIIGCSNQETKKVVDNEISNTNDEAKFWKVEQSGFTTPEGEYELVGEVGKYGILRKPFVVEEENEYTWYFWIDDKNKLNEMIGKKVELYGISEKSVEKQLLSTSKIEKINNDDPEVPMSELSLKFNAVLELPIKGKWKIESYVDDNLLNATIVFVEGKDGL